MPDSPPIPRRDIILRLPEDLLRRIHAHQRRLQQAHPGMVISREETIRTLLHSALAAEEPAARDE